MQVNYSATLWLASLVAGLNDRESGKVEKRSIELFLAKVEHNYIDVLLMLRTGMVSHSVKTCSMIAGSS